MSTTHTRGYRGSWSISGLGSLLRSCLVRVLLFAMLVIIAAAMPTVPPVHEDVHQRAGQQQKKWQRAEEVGAVFGEQEIQSNAAQDDQTDR